MKNSNVKNFELVNKLDGDGNTVRVVTREEAECANYTIENVLIFVFDSFGKVWLHKRPDNKQHYPGLWDISACGAVVSGESPLQAARREQEEEMGFTCDLEYVETFLNIFTDNGVTRRRLSHIFIGRSDIEPQPTPDAAAFLAVPHDELSQLVQADKNSYVPSLLVEYEKVVHKVLKYQ